jgi:hypothetical protein
MNDEILFYLSASELANTLRVPKATVYAAIRSGRCRPTARTNREILFSSDCLLKHLSGLSGFLKAEKYADCFVIAEQLDNAMKTIASGRRRGEIKPQGVGDIIENEFPSEVESPAPVKVFPDRAGGP